MLTCRLSLSHSSCLHTAVLLQPRVELFRYDVEARRFDAYLPGLSPGPVDFSFDRKWITYVLYPEMTLWRSKLDGNEKMQLTFHRFEHLDRDGRLTMPKSFTPICSMTLPGKSVWSPGQEAVRKFSCRTISTWGIQTGCQTENPSFLQNLTEWAKERFINWI